MRARRLILAATALALANVGSGPAHTREEDPRVTALMQTIERLEARLAALEAKQATAASHLPRPAAVTRQELPRSAALSDNRWPTTAHASIAAPTWSGLFVGASIGAATQRIGYTGSNTGITRQSSFGFDWVTVTQNLLSGHGDDSWGAVGDFFVGYNYQPAPNIVLGLQLEGTLAQLSNNVTAANASQSGTSWSTLTNISQLQMLWAASALARAGWSPDGQNLFYGLAGWTYARFHSDNLQTHFSLQGPTVGAGWERRLLNNWTLRGEYRYTAFKNEAVVYQVGSNTTASPGFLFANSNAGVAQVHGDMHALRIGASYRVWD